MSQNQKLNNLVQSLQNVFLDDCVMNPSKPFLAPPPNETLDEVITRLYNAGGVKTVIASYISSILSGKHRYRRFSAGPLQDILDDDKRVRFIKNKDGKEMKPSVKGKDNSLYAAFMSEMFVKAPILKIIKPTVQGKPYAAIVEVIDPYLVSQMGPTTHSYAERLCKSVGVKLHDLSLELSDNQEPITENEELITKSFTKPSQASPSFITFGQVGSGTVIRYSIFGLLTDKFGSIGKESISNWSDIESKELTNKKIVKYENDKYFVVLSAFSTAPELIG